MLTQGLISHSQRGAKHWLLRIGLGFTILLMGASFALAQVTGSATVRGVVKDPAGAVVPRANVSLINNSTKFERKAKTTDEGLYNFSSLDPGTYTLKVEAQGFKAYEETGIIVNASDTRGLDAVMEVGAANETVTIQASVEVIQKETGAKENTITAKTIDNTSIISRSALELLKILPGVVAPNETDLQSVTFGGGANANASYNVNGLRGEENNISIDGSRLMDIGSNNGTIITANADMVQEVKVQTSNYSAEYGSAGVQITATTKNGSSGFHGEVYDYIRNYRFNANDRSNTLFGVGKTQDTYQYPGGNIGGPVLIPGTRFNKNRDKLFFFFGYEVQRQQVQLNTIFDVVPTLAQRAGHFADIGKDFDPNANPIGKVFINQYPLPNFTDPNPADKPLLNYASQGLQPTNRTQAVGRVDYNINSNTKLYVRLAREAESQDFARGLWWNPSNYELPSHVHGDDLGRSLSASLVRVINPTLTNEVVVSASKLLLNNDYADPSKVSLSSLGLSSIYKGPFGQQSQYVPLAFITQWGGATHGNLWSPGGNPLFSHNSSFSVTDNATKVKGAHTIKFGTLIEQADKIQNFNGNTEGFYVYAPWGNHSTGNEFADLLTGRPAQISQATKTPIGNFRLHNFEFYGQDSWKVKPNLTLEFGLRADYFPNNYEATGFGVLFDPGSYDHTQGVLINNDPNKPNGILTAKSGAIPKGVVSTPGVQWAPRLNFAWDINGRGDTVIRGGAGIFYNRVQGNYQYYSLQQPPNSYSEDFNSYSFGSLGNGTGLTYNTMSQINPFAQFGGIGITTANPHSIFIPRIANMSFSIARRLPSNTVVEVAYVGTQGRHLPDNINTNFIPVGTLLKGHVGNADLSVPVQRWAVAGQSGVLAQFRPFPAYSSITNKEFNATSSYHSLQVTASHQTGKNLQFFATYTFSKALGTTAINENDGNGVDPIDTRHRSWGVLPYDRTHIFNLSYNYNLPSPARGKLDNKLTRGVLSGWQMSGITTFQSGQPIRLRFGGDLFGGNAALAYFGSDAFANTAFASGPVAPIFTKNPTISGNSFQQKILDLNAIQIPPLGSTGAQVSPFYLRAPHRWNHDISFFKNFRITESKKIQFRAGFFNIFNQAYPLFNTDPSQSDINTQLIANCNKKLDGVPNGTGGTSDGICDPTQGFHFDPATVQNFGRITSKHGHRIIELAVKFYF